MSVKGIGNKTMFSLIQGTFNWVGPPLPSLPPEPESNYRVKVRFSVDLVLLLSSQR